MKRYGSLIEVRPEKLTEYIELHAEVWPGVLAQLQRSNIRNYSIYFKDGFLFSYFEYIGTSFEDDMNAMGSDPIVQQWWAVCKACHRPLETRKEGEWWAEMEEIFHVD